MNAYPETYLNRAMTTLGEMFDYAIVDCGIAGQDFIEMFVYSSACRKLENGEASYLLGKSGIEIAIECIEGTGKHCAIVEPKESYSRSAEYWCGWSSCYYQWLSCRRYYEIFDAIPFKEMMRLYQTLHEADIDKVADVFGGIVKRKYSDTNLKRIRTAYGCSQQELAKLAGVSLRSIQMYEQRKKDINKAQSESIFKLSKALGCKMEDLLERP
jgi:DNA-binding XRE family transcriptional regulator